MAEWRTIPGFAGYVINDEGDCVSPLGNALTRTGQHKDCYRLRKRDGTVKGIYIWRLLDMARKRGRVVSSLEEAADEKDTVETPIPDGFVPIPNHSHCCINRGGEVWNRETKAFLQWHSEGRITPRVCLHRGRLYSVNKLLELTFGAGAAEKAGLPTPKKCGGRKRTDELIPSRRCHDCQTPTTDYRCPRCLKKWRARNGVAENGGGEDTSFDVLYI